MINDNNFTVILFQTSSNSKTLPVHINNGASRLVLFSSWLLLQLKTAATEMFGVI